MCEFTYALLLQPFAVVQNKVQRLFKFAANRTYQENKCLLQ